MTTFKARLEKFKDRGEKTGWVYIAIPASIARKLKPNTKSTFRVKGTIDAHTIRQVALLPMGGGDFILAVNAAMRKQIKKPIGSTVDVNIQLDQSAFEWSEEFMMCLEDDPIAIKKFKSLPLSHQKYFSKWIDSAKTEATKTKRITQSLQGLAMGLNYGEMIRYFKGK